MSRVDGCETNREECWSINVEAVENLVRCCRQHGSNLVQISTDFIFDGEDGPYDEGARPNPVNFYGKSKLAAENALRQLGPDKWTIIRTVLVYGTGVGLKRSNIGMWIIDELANGRPIRVFSDQLRSPTYVDDLAAGIGRVLRFERTGVFNISGREFMSIYDFAVEMARAFGFDASLVSPVTCDEMELTAPRPPKTGFIILKAETELGYKPHSLSKALEALRLKINPPVSHTS